MGSARAGECRFCGIAARGVVDKEIVVPVSVQGVADKGMISYEFDLRYDPAVIQPLENSVDVTGTVSRGLSVVTNATEPRIVESVRRLWCVSDRCGWGAC